MWRPETVVTRWISMVAGTMTIRWMRVAEVTTTQPRFESGGGLGLVDSHMRSNHFPTWVVLVGMRAVVSLMRKRLWVRVDVVVNRIHFT